MLLFKGLFEIWKLSVLCALVVLMPCCSDVEDGVIENNEPDNIIIPIGNENYLNLKSDYIFDQNKLHTFELNLPSSSLKKLDDDPTAEEYVEGSLTFEGETISQVGIRYKGSIGAYVGCVSGSDWTNPSGIKTCTKLSIKVKANWLDSDDKFYGLKKLQFHSQNLDDSQMRDRLGYHLFREMGVPAPRCVHARLIINGEYTGVYALVEQIDGRFTRQNFDDGKGNLYKEIWPLSDRGVPFSESEYIRSLETNEDEDPSAEMIRAFGSQIQHAESDDSLKSVISRWMNIDEIVAYVAVDRMIRVDDGPFHWYCGGGGCSSHNYYWYEEPSQRTMHLIPWDLDNAFENIVFDKNPVTPIADEWGQIRSNCQPFRYGTFNLTQKSAACDKLIAGWVLFEEELIALQEKFRNGPFKESSVNALLDQWSAQIRSSTKEASEKHGDAVTESQWDAAVQELKSGLEFARNQ